MTIPDSIVEATEKGMVGENLLCANVPSMERAAPGAETTESGTGGGVGSSAAAAVVGRGDGVRVLTRAEEAGGVKGMGGEGHVRIKGVDC